MRDEYEVIGPDGQPKMGASAAHRYPRRVELDMLEVGYTIRLHGKKLTKTELRKETKTK